MKKIINKIGAAALMMAVAASTVSCSSDYLDTNPTSSVGSSQALGSTEFGMKALNGIASSMSTQQYMFSQGFCGENYIMNKMECYPSQNYLYNYYAAGWAPLINAEWNNRTNSSYNAYGWYYYYNLIGQANSIIVNIDAATGTDEEKAFVKASALTFRAYAYEKLCHYYCVRWQDSQNGAADGLILQLDETTDGKPRATMAETYAQIYKDCDEALSLFQKSGMDRAAGEVWIANANVAHAVYARAALTKQDYSKALEQAKLAEAGYPLMTNAEYQAGFCNPTSEWIFGSYGSANENNWYWSYGTQYSCNGYYASSQPTGAGAIGRELINRIPNNDARKALFLTEDKFPNHDWSPANKDQYLQTYCIMGMYDDELWDEVTCYISQFSPVGEAEDVELNELELDENGNPKTDKNGNYVHKKVKVTAYLSGYYYLGGQLKFWVFDTPGVGYLPFIRTSEMVLIEAEANYFLNNAAAAQAALVKLNAESGRNPEYTCSKTGQDLFDEIKDYRELELWGECSWSDYKRWNLPVVRKTFAQGGNSHAAAAVTIPADGANNWTWGIPQSEYDYNDCLDVNGKNITK